MIVQMVAQKTYPYIVGIAIVIGKRHFFFLTVNNRWNGGPQVSTNHQVLTAA